VSQADKLVGEWEIVGLGTTRILPHAELVGRDDLSGGRTSTGLATWPPTLPPASSLPHPLRFISTGEDPTAVLASSSFSSPTPLILLATAAVADRALRFVPLVSEGFVGVSHFAPPEAGVPASRSAATACIPARAASMQRGISSESTWSSWWRMSSR